MVVCSSIHSFTQLYPGLIKVKGILLVGEKGKYKGKDKTFAGVTGNIQHGQHSLNAVLRVSACQTVLDTILDTMKNWKPEDVKCQQGSIKTGQM